jgi:hypothetical protein
MVISTWQVERVYKVVSGASRNTSLTGPAMGEEVWVLEGLQEINMPPMPRLIAAMAAQSDEIQCDNP